MPFIEHRNAIPAGILPAHRQIRLYGAVHDRHGIHFTNLFLLIIGTPISRLHITPFPVPVLQTAPECIGIHLRNMNGIYYPVLFDK